MTLRTIEIVYPEGDRQEIEHDLSIDDLVDLNGNPLPLPLPSTRMIVYRVFRMRRNEDRGIDTCSYYLEQLSARELEAYVR